MLGIKSIQYSFAKQLENEIQFIKDLKGCDQLAQAHAVYVCLHLVDGIKKDLGEPVSKSPKGLAGAKI